MEGKRQGEDTKKIIKKKVQPKKERGGEGQRTTSHINGSNMLSVASQSPIGRRAGGEPHGATRALNFNGGNSHSPLAA